MLSIKEVQDKFNIIKAICFLKPIKNSTVATELWISFKDNTDICIHLSDPFPNFFNLNRVTEGWFSASDFKKDRFIQENVKRKIITTLNESKNEEGNLPETIDEVLKFLDPLP